MKAINEWNDLIADMEKIYIYGAGMVAEKISDLLAYSDKKDCLMGYIVSSVKENPSEIDGIPVIPLGDSIDKRATVLVSLSEAYHPEVFQKLKEMGFVSVIHAHKFFGIDIRNTTDKAFNRENCIDEDVQLSNELVDYRDRMISKYFEYSHAFGRKGFYQSSPMMGIRGTRNTVTRLKIYGLTDFISPNSSILDIGSNIGFLDMEISKYVGEIIGLEYSDILVEIANETAKAVGINNVKFISVDYNVWQKNNTQKFDVIFSFAVHAWLNVKPDVYARQIVNMLNENGFLVFESQQLSTDKLFDDFVNALKKENLKILKEDIVNDDVEETVRKFLVMKKI